MYRLMLSRRRKSLTSPGTREPNLPRNDSNSKNQKMFLENLPAAEGKSAATRRLEVRLGSNGYSHDFMMGRVSEKYTLMNCPSS